MLICPRLIRRYLRITRGTEERTENSTLNSERTRDNKKKEGDKKEEMKSDDGAAA